MSGRSRNGDAVVGSCKGICFSSSNIWLLHIVFRFNSVGMHFAELTFEIK